MDFLAIQEDVKLDRFSENQRAAIKSAINSRYGRVWAQEPWSFKRALVTFSLSAGDDTVTLTEVGLQKVDVVYSNLPGDFSKLYGDRPELALNWAETSRGTGDAFTVIGNSIKLNRPPTSTTNLQLIGQLKWAPLVADIDVPLIPEEYHYMLVQGAAADILLREADPTWQGEEKGFNDQLEEMRKSYMSVQPMAQGAYPSWP